MASVQLSQKLRNKLHEEVGSRLFASVFVRAKEEGRLYLDPDVLTEFVSACVPDEVRGESEFWARLKENDLDFFNRMKSGHVGFVSKLAFSVDRSDVAADRFETNYYGTSRLMARCPDTLMFTKANRYDTGQTFDVPEQLYGLFFDVHTQLSTDLGTAQAMRSAALEFVEARNTAGQVRRDWPELVSFLPESRKAVLNATVARGAINYEAMPPRWLRNKINEHLEETMFFSDVELKTNLDSLHPVMK